MSHLDASTPHGRPPLRALQVLGGGSAGSSAHVRSLAAGLVARGVHVTVCAPAGLEQDYDFTGAGARFVPVARRSDPVSVAALRSETAAADLVHAHGLNAGARTALALGARRGRPGRRRAPLVVTWHTRRHTEGARARIQRLAERRVARSAAVVLGTSSDLVDRARRRGARDARLAPIAFPPSPAPAPGTACTEEETGTGAKARAELGVVERPLLMAVGSLHPDRGYRTLLDATRAWRSLEPVPLLVIAGEGPERAALQGRIDTEVLPALLAGSRHDVAELLAVADVAVLPSRWESRSLLAQEALHAGVPLVATAVGGVPELVGDAAELVPYGDAKALAQAVARLLAEPGRRTELGDKGRAQAASWPTEDETVTQLLGIYDELAQPVLR